jgi:hypothetical protein
MRERIEHRMHDRRRSGNRAVLSNAFHADWTADLKLAA